MWPLRRLLPAVAFTLTPTLASAEPSKVACFAKSFPNLPGQNAVSLTREANGSYTARYEAYGPAKTKKGLRCRFDEHPQIFHCMTSNTAFALVSTQVHARGITDEGKVSEEHLFKIEALRSPLGDVHVEQELSFPIEACRVGP